MSNLFSGMVRNNFLSFYPICFFTALYNRRTSYIYYNRSVTRINMKINNVTQFSNFIEQNDISKLDGIFSQIVNCINNYSKACNCYKLEDKQRMYVDCNKLYNNAIRNVVPRFKGDILSKIPERQISFYADNGSLISIVSR